MKKNIRKICLLTLLLTLISFIFILYMGRTYIAVFDVHNENYKFSVEEGIDNIEILE